MGESGVFKASGRRQGRPSDPSGKEHRTRNIPTLNIERGQEGSKFQASKLNHAFPGVMGVDLGTGVDKSNYPPGFLGKQILISLCYVGLPIDHFQYGAILRTQGFAGMPSHEVVPIVIIVAARKVDAELAIAAPKLG